MWRLIPCRVHEFHSIQPKTEVFTYLAVSLHRENCQEDVEDMICNKNSTRDRRTKPQRWIRLRQWKISRWNCSDRVSAIITGLRFPSNRISCGRNLTMNEKNLSYVGGYHTSNQRDHTFNKLSNSFSVYTYYRYKEKMWYAAKMENCARRYKNNYIFADSSIISLNLNFVKICIVFKI
jgi:hypothetical protein